MKLSAKELILKVAGVDLRFVLIVAGNRSLNTYGNHAYKSTIDAIAHWPETVTAVGVRLDEKNDIQVISPYGLEDLFHMVVRRSPLFQNKEYYLNRVKSKGWINQWPLLKLIED